MRTERPTSWNRKRPSVAPEGLRCAILGDAFAHPLCCTHKPLALIYGSKVDRSLNHRDYVDGSVRYIADRIPKSIPLRLHHEIQLLRLLPPDP